MYSLVTLWADFVIKKRPLVLFVSLVFLVLGIITGSGIPFNNNTEQYFVEGDANLTNFNKLLDLFGDNEYLVVGIEAKENDSDIFYPETINLVEAITDFLERQEYVTQVRSITRYQYTDSSQGSLNTDYLIKDVGRFSIDHELQDEARSKIKTEPLALGTIVTSDLKHTRIAARVDYIGDTAKHKVELVNRLYHFVHEEGLDQKGYRIHYSGRPVLNYMFEVFAQEDSKILNPLMLFLITGILFLHFRSFVFAIAPWAVVISSISCLLGIQSLLKYPHTPIDSALVPTMIIIGIGASVHILTEFSNNLTTLNNSKRAAKNAIIEIWKPCFFTALTTSVGFLALSVTNIDPVKEFALLGALAPLLIFIFATTTLPALLSYKNFKMGSPNEKYSTSYISTIMHSLPGFTLKYRLPIFFLLLLSMIFITISVPRLNVDTNFFNYFKKDNPARIDMLYFDDVFDGALSLEFIIDSGDKQGIKDPSFLTQVELLQKSLEEMDFLGKSNSVVDYLKDVNQSLNNDDPDYYILPSTREMVAQMLFLYRNSGPDEDLSDILDFDERYVRLSIPTKNMSASELSVKLELISELLRTEFSNLNVSLTGDVVMFHAQEEYTNEGMFKSFYMALVLICICFVVVFRSVKYGLLSVVPSIIPILMTGGIVALLDINLDLGTMVIGAITMGIAVDDAIHFMNRYVNAKKNSKNTKASILEATTTTGRAVLLSSIVLVLGFSVLSFASFVPVILTGLFVALIMTLAVIGDLVCLPALLFLVDSQTEESIKTTDFSSQS